jgi:predicted 2-oxoglutarate/Fe(II)-dependent dioxygenase YbiX
MKIVENFLTRKQCLDLINLDLEYVHLHKNAGYDNPDRENNLNNEVYVGFCRLNKTPQYYTHIIDKFLNSKIVNMFILRYEKDSFLDLHIDTPPPSDFVGKNFFSIVLLNTDFTGGELVFPKLNKTFGTESVGHMIQVPTDNMDSSLLHGVSKVTAGTRYSLVIKSIIEK